MNNGIELSSVAQQSRNNTTQNDTSVNVNVRNNDTNERKDNNMDDITSNANDTGKGNNEIKEDIKYDDEKMDNDVTNNGIKISLYNNGYQNEGFYYGKIYIGSNNHEINVSFDTAADNIFIFENQYKNYNKSKTFNPKPLPTDMSSIKVQKFDDSLQVKGPICNDIIKYNKTETKTQNIKFLFATEIHNMDCDDISNFGLGKKNNIYNEFAFYFDNKNNHKNSNLIVNGYDKSILTDNYHEIKLTNNDNDYCFNINEFNVINNDNNSINLFKNIKVKLDSNSNRIFLPTNYYNKAINTILDDIKYDEIETKDKQYKSILIESKYQSKLPILSFKINNNITLTLNGYQYTRICSINNKYCWLDLQELNTCDNIILGIPFLTHNYIVFNIENNSIKLKEFNDDYNIISRYNNSNIKPRYAPGIFCRDNFVLTGYVGTWDGERNFSYSGGTLRATWEVSWSGEDFTFVNASRQFVTVSPSNIVSPVRWGLMQIVPEFENAEVPPDYRIAIHGYREADRNTDKTLKLVYKFYTYTGHMSSYYCEPPPKPADDATTVHKDHRVIWKIIDTPLYRNFHNSRHHYDITSTSEDTKICRILRSGASDGISMYRYIQSVANNHILGMSSSPDVPIPGPRGGGTTQRIGRATLGQVDGMVPLYHYRKKWNHDTEFDDYFGTESEAPDGYFPFNHYNHKTNNILCYVYPL